jgi:Cdc6-like AAA superfamily ATPase
MEARAFAGDRLTAIRIFQAWRQRLLEELDATPSKLVEGMALRLRQRGYEPPGTSHIPTVRTDQWRNRAFVGRASQYRSLYERWERTNKGEGRHGLVLGESGIGKTTLVERLVTAAGLEGAVSSRVQCYEVEREIPYAAIGTLVRGLLDRPGVSGTPPEWLAELARTIPEVARRYPNLPAARDTVGETARLRLTEALHELTSAVAEEHPVILVVDDVHLADDASVAVLHLIMRRTQEQRIMVILTARESELARSPHAGRLKESRESLALAPVELPPLTDEEMNEVVTALAADALVPPAIRQAMLRAATGIPMLAELLFDDWRSNGDQCLAISVGAMTVDALGHPGDEVYRRVFDRLFRDLSPAARAVVNLAAILGDRLNDLAMYELVDLTLAQTLTGMSELADLRILRDGGREVEFRNELLRNYTYLNVPSPLRRALHGLIADRLLGAEASGEKVPGLMLAWHCFRAGRPVQAEPYLLRGSSEALRRGGVFEVELALTSAMATLTRPSVREAQLLLAEALQEQNRHREALQLVEGTRPDGAPISAREQLIRARSLTAAQPQPQEAQRLIDSLEQLLLDEAARSSWPAVLQAITEVAYHWGRQTPAQRYLNHARRISTAQLDIEDRVKLEYSLAFFNWLAGERRDVEVAANQFKTLIEQCKRDGLTNLATWHLCAGASVLLNSSGAYLEAVGLTSTGYEIAARLGNDAKMSSAAMNRSICELRLGNYDHAKYWAEKATSHAKSQDHVWRRVQPAYYWALSLCMLGENRRAVEAVDIIASTAVEPAPAWCLQAGPLMAADILWASGDEAQAIRLARESLESRGIQPILDSFTGMFGRWVGLTSLGTDWADAAAQEIHRLSTELELHDLVDRAEIIGTRLVVDHSRGVPWDDGPDQLRKVLSQLPPAVECQLQRLGTLRL